MIFVLSIFLSYNVPIITSKTIFNSIKTIIFGVNTPKIAIQALKHPQEYQKLKMIPKIKKKHKKKGSHANHTKRKKLEILIT